MQTFLPYSDFALSARCLDRQRLGKQRVENIQILKALTDLTYGWQNHPAVKMWRGHEWLLADYQQAICTEWTDRSYTDTCLTKFLAILNATDLLWINETLPLWLGDHIFHRSHQSNLVRKNPEFYRPVFPTVPDNLPYIWPEP